LAAPGFLALSILCAVLLTPGRQPAEAAPPIEAAPTGVAPTAEPDAYRQTTSGLLARTIFSTSQTGGIAVEIVDLLVGPGQVTHLPKAGFAALLEVQAGRPALLVDGKAVMATPGGVISINEGQSLAIDNTSEQRPFIARLIKLSTPEP